MVRDDAFYLLGSSHSLPIPSTKNKSDKNKQCFSLFSVASYSNRGKVLSFCGRYIGQVVRFDVVYVYRQAKLPSLLFLVFPSTPASSLYSMP